MAKLAHNQTFALSAPTGTIIPYLGPAAPAGWIFAAGTIGNSASGASARANADTFPLFSHLWNTLASSVATVTGGRGASAKADFDAGKQLSLPDMRGRSTVGKSSTMSLLQDEGTWTSAQTLGAWLGTNGYTLASNHMPSHTHSVSGQTDNAYHRHSISSGEGGPVNDQFGDIGDSYENPVRVYFGNANESGMHTHDYWLPNSPTSASPHQNMQPSRIVNYLIKL